MPKVYRKEVLKSMGQSLTKRHGAERHMLFGKIEEGQQYDGIVKRDGPYGDLYIPVGGIKVHVPGIYKGKRIWPGYTVTYRVLSIDGDSAIASIEDA